MGTTHVKAEELQLGQVLGGKPKTPGQIAYEHDVGCNPNYSDGTPRRKWHELPEWSQWSWERRPLVEAPTPLTDVPDPVVKVRPVGSPSKFIDWRISQNLTDRWGDINNHNEANKPLELLVGTPGLLDRLREQMWDEICFVVRRDGQFGILFEVEYVSHESDSADHDSEFTEELKPICEMMKIIADASMEKLVSKFPGVEFAIPDEGEIVKGRPALWAWVPDGLLTAEQRKDLGMLMLNL